MPRIKPKLTDNYTDNVITEIEDGQHPYPSVAGGIRNAGEARDAACRRTKPACSMSIRPTPSKSRRTNNMPLNRLKSTVAAEILKDQGAPKKLTPDEQWSGTDLDDVSRSSFPDIEDISAAETPANRGADSKVYSGIKRKTGQPGTT